jgi:large repetitive protein
VTKSWTTVGTKTVKCIVTDMKGGTATQTLTIDVATAATFAVSGKITTSAAVAISGVLVSDGTRSATTNATGDYSITGVPNGTFTLTPTKAGYTFSPVNKSVTVSGANVAAQNFTGAITNTAPTANAQSVTTNEDTAKAITLTGTDPQSNPLTYIIVANPTKGVLSGTGAARTYTPNANANGADSFTFKVNDGSLDSNIATVTITVTAINDAPVAAGQAVAVAKNVAKAITLSGSDVEGSALTYTVVSNPINGTLTGTGASRSYTPTASYVGADSFTFKVNDGTVDSAVATVSISVQNTAPVANAQSVTTNEDTAKAITLTGSDANGDPLTYSIVADPTKGVLSGTGAARTYTPNTNATGTDSFTFKVNDGTVDGSVATVSITITGINDAPVANAQTVTTNEDTAKAITLAANDVDGNPLTYTVLTNPTKGVLSGAGAARTYTPNANTNGADSFTFKVNDGTVDSNTATVTINVVAVNDIPVANAQNVIALKNIAKAITLTGSDVEGSTLTYTVVTNPLNGVLSGTGAARTYTPNANYVGADSFTFKVNDGTVDSATATVSITVQNTNSAPAADAQTVTTNEDTAKAITLTGSDADGNALTYIIVANPTKGVLSGTGAARTYTPNANANGADSFTFKVNDGIVDSGVATVSITITAVNDVPVAVNQSTNTLEDTAKAITLGAIDVDGNPLTFTLVTVPAKGALTGSGSLRTYTPNPDVNGADSFSFRVSDGLNFSNTATVSITITAVNDGPVITSAATATPNPASVAQAISFSAAGSDVDSAALTYTWNFGDATSGSGASISHAYAAAGTYAAVVTVSDGSKTTTSSVSVSVVAAGGSAVDETGGGSDPNAGGGDTVGGGGGGAVMPGVDSDHDGVSDEHEAADGTDPNNAGSFNKTQMTLKKLQGGANFTSAGRDICSVSGTIPDLPAGFDPTGVVVSVDVGGAKVSFTMDAKGKAISANGMFAIKLKPSKRNKVTGKIDFLGGPVTFSAKLKGSFASAWIDEGVTAVDMKNAPVQIVVDIPFAGRVYTATVSASCSAKSTTGAKFKN